MTLAFAGSIGMTLVILACALPEQSYVVIPSSAIVKLDLNVYNHTIFLI